MTVAIEIRQVVKRYGTLTALDGIDLDIAEGEFFGLLGPNGAGKTTLISALAGLVRADQGTLKILGHDVVTDFRAARRSLGVVPQELVFDPFFTVRETLRIQSGYFGLRNNDAWIDEVMANLDLTSKADVNMRKLSGGMKRRVLVAQALVHKPHLIAGKQLSLTLGEGTIPESLMPLVSSAAGSHYTLKFKDYTEIEQILAQLRAAGCGIDDMEIEQADLEDVFVSLMRGEPRVTV
jgi:ABC-type multidrug transport system ATPase subunit